MSGSPSLENIERRLQTEREFFHAYQRHVNSAGATLRSENFIQPANLLQHEKRANTKTVNRHSGIVEFVRRG